MTENPENVRGRITVLDARVESAREKNKKIWSEMEDRMKENNIVMEAAKEEKDELIAELLRGRGLDGLRTDVDFARFVYSSMWDGGMGSHVICEALTDLCEHVPFLLSSSSEFTLDDAGNAARNYCVHIPRGAGKDDLSVLAETLSDLLAVGEKILEGDTTPRISVLDDDLSRGGIHEICPGSTKIADELEWYDDRENIDVAGKWFTTTTSFGTLQVDREFDSLVDALVWVSENWTYGSLEV